MTDRNKWIDKFVATLRRLEPDPNGDDDSRGKAMLAQLRRSFADDGCSVLSRAGYLFPPVLECGELALKHAMLVAGLFAIHPKDLRQDPKDRKNIVNLGQSLRNIRLETDLSKPDPFDRRFVHLIDADADQLPERLRHAIRLLKAKSENTRVNYAQLLRDLIRWNYPERRAQWSWSRSYWTSYANKESELETVSPSEGEPQ